MKLSPPGILGPALVLVLAWMAPAVASAKKPGRERSELKMVVPPDRVAAAFAALRLAEKTPASLEVVFFDTADAALQSRNVILRVRHRAGTPGDSTVKIRTTTNDDALGEAEKAITPELDWINPDAPAVSRSISHELPPDQYNAVLHDGASAETLFSDKQRQLVETRRPGLAWTDLVAHGPVRAEVWDRQCKLKGFPKPVTVERWHLERGGQKAEIFEVSVKVSTSSETEAKELAIAFFQAAEDAGFGRPSGQSKTQLVLDFFRPSK